MKNKEFKLKGKNQNFRRKNKTKKQNHSPKILMLG